MSKATELAERSIIKTTVNLPSDSVSMVKHLAQARGTSVAEIIRRAIWIENLLFNEINNGSTILVKTSDEKIKELVIR